MLLLFAGTPAAAQQPGRPLPGRPALYGTPFPTTVGRQVMPTGQGQPRFAAETPPAAPTGTPDTGVPPGYRSVGGAGQAPPAAAERTGFTGGSGKVMYFHKPADALAADLPADAGAVALAAASEPVAVPPIGVPDVPPPALGAVPPPVRTAIPDRPIPTAPPVPVPVVAQQPDPKLADPAQPNTGPMTAQDRPIEPAQVPPEVKQLPPRDKIFLMYDDASLERAVIQSVRRTILEQAEKNKDPKAKPPDVSSLQFPPLAQVVPPGTEYVAKTGGYPPNRAVYEPGFVVHRRLHFEEKNSERYGWDLGFISPLVSTAYFYKDALLWPNSLATGLVKGTWDTSAGKCLPGNPVPYYLYPPGLTITGTTVEAAVITGAAFIVP